MLLALTASRTARSKFLSLKSVCGAIGYGSRNGLRHPPTSTVFPLVPLFNSHSPGGFQRGPPLRPQPSPAKAARIPLPCAVAGWSDMGCAPWLPPHRPIDHSLRGTQRPGPFRGCSVERLMWRGTGAPANSPASGTGSGSSSPSQAFRRPSYLHPQEAA